MEAGLDRAAKADLVAVPAMARGGVVPDEVLEALAAAYDRGARILSVCSGAFTLGEAGLLDGRECTTHWRHTRELAERYPRARVVPEVLYVDDGQVITSAGTAAGMDAALHLWRQEYGAGVASAVARRMVVPPQRDGGQAQFIARAVPDCDVETLGPLLEWIVENLGEDLDVESLARRALMSPRTFARRFRAETGVTPHAWVTSQRVLARRGAARAQPTAPWSGSPSEVGFGNAAALRHHFAGCAGSARSSTADASPADRTRPPPAGSRPRARSCRCRRAGAGPADEGPRLGRSGASEPLAREPARLVLGDRAHRRGTDSLPPAVVGGAVHSPPSPLGVGVASGRLASSG